VLPPKGLAPKLRGRGEEGYQRGSLHTPAVPFIRLPIDRCGVCHTVAVKLVAVKLGKRILKSGGGYLAVEGIYRGDGRALALERTTKG